MVESMPAGELILCPGGDLPGMPVQSKNKNDCAMRARSQGLVAETVHYSSLQTLINYEVVDGPPP